MFPFNAPVLGLALGDGEAVESAAAVLPLAEVVLDEQCAVGAAVGDEELALLGHVGHGAVVEGAGEGLGPGLRGEDQGRVVAVVVLVPSVFLNSMLPPIGIGCVERDQN